MTRFGWAALMAATAPASPLAAECSARAINAEGVTLTGAEALPHCRVTGSIAPRTAAYGHTSVRDLNPTAEALLQGYYGKDLAYSHGIGGSLAQILTAPPTKVGGSPEELEQFLMGDDIPARAGEIFARTDAFPESAMDFMTPPGLDDPKLAEFKAAGGKVLILHGQSDPVFSVRDTARWYDRLDANNGGKAEDFALFYRNPGMPHGAGGPSTDDFDILSPLVDWVENGKAPGAITAGVTAENAEGQAALGNITRQLCPYPQVARYKGGDAASAQSFACE